MRRCEKSRIAIGAIKFGILLLFMAKAVRLLDQRMIFLKPVPSSALTVFADTLILAGTILSIFKTKEIMTRVRGSIRPWVSLLIIGSMMLVAYGFIRGNPLQPFILESCLIVVYLSGIILGVHLHNMTWICRGYLYGLAFIAVPCITLGLVWASSLDLMGMIETKVYFAQSILLPAFFFILIIDKPWSYFYRIVPWVAAFVYALIQIITVKRAPLLRIIFFMVVSIVLLSLYKKRSRKLNYLVRILTLAFVIILGIYLIFPTIPELRSSINERFLSIVASVKFTFNPAEGLEPVNYYEETFRLREVAIAYRAMNPIEKVIGTGIGGYVVAPEFRNWEILDRLENDYYESARIPEGRDSLHLGVFWPFLKGGVLYWMIFYIVVLSAIFSYRDIRSSALRISCWYYLLGMLIFQFMEGHWMLSGLDLTAFLVGASIGVCISSERSLQLPNLSLHSLSNR